MHNDLTIRGFAFIEVLLTLILIALLFGGFASLFLVRKQELQQSFTERALDDQQSRILSNHFKLFVNYPSADTPNYNQTYQDLVPFFPENSQIIKGTSRDVNGSDTIWVRYHGNDNDDVFSCLGTPLNPKQSTESFFYIHNEGKLACSIVENGTPNLKNPNILIENVEIMHIRYGEDTDHDGIVNRYVSANFPDLSLNRVITVKISLLARIGEPINPLLTSKYYQLDDIEFGPYNDHFARKILTFSLPVNVAAKHAS